MKKRFPGRSDNRGSALAVDPDINLDAALVEASRNQTANRAARILVAKNGGFVIPTAKQKRLLLVALADDAIQRNQRRSDYYFLSERVLRTFKRFQELPESASFPGIPVEQAYWIWRQTPRSPFFALLEANGLSLSRDFIQVPAIT